MKSAPIGKCPHCGSLYGFFIKGYMQGRTQERYDWNGKYGDNSDMHDGLTASYGKYAYCTDCEKRLFKVEEDE